MAWNPAPEVQIARDAAASMGKVMKSGVDRCIVYFTLDDGRLGYASYGRTSALCAHARRMADSVFDTLQDWIGEETPTPMEQELEQCKKLLRQIAESDGYACSICGGEDKHKAGCELSKAIRASEP